METTVGQLMVNDSLPESMRDYNRALDKKGLRKLLNQLATEYPERYREVSHKLSNIGRDAAYTTGGNSFGLEHLQKSAKTRQLQRQLQQQLDAILDDDEMDDDHRDEEIIKIMGRAGRTQASRIYEEALAEDNPLAMQVLSGSRGNPNNLASLLGSDLLYTDHRDRVLPVPVLHSYSEGLRPVEYWAGAYGARKGVIDTKFATMDAGFLSKQLNQVAHRALVTGLDADKPFDSPIGLPVGVDDDESEGALLAYPAGEYKRNTIITPKILQDLKRQNVKRILVRSPAVSGTLDGGVYARDVGIREFGRLPEIGENVGMTAAQALSEPLNQAQLSSKHSGGVAGATAGAVSGFDYINQLVQVPKTFKGGAAHAEIDGLVTRVEDAPAGGKYVWINDTRHYVGKDFATLVKRGDHVEAGDVISEGAPNPATVVKHKGIGEGKRYFINTFRQAFRDAGISGHRRNIELLARGLINHVRLNDEVGDYVPDDILTYGELAAAYKPRPGYEDREPRAAVGRYLEQPYLHYSIGTQLKPSMMQDFDDFGIKQVRVHTDPPPFEPEMVRGMANLQHDPDWITRMFGSGLKSSLLKGVHTGATSDPLGTSFVPGLAAGAEFGQAGQVVTPQRELRKAAAEPITQDEIDEMMGNLKYHTPEEHQREKSVVDWMQSVPFLTEGVGFTPQTWWLPNALERADEKIVRPAMSSITGNTGAWEGARAARDAAEAPAGGVEFTPEQFQWAEGGLGAAERWEAQQAQDYQDLSTPARVATHGSYMQYIPELWQNTPIIGDTLAMPESLRNLAVDQLANRELSQLSLDNPSEWGLYDAPGREPLPVPYLPPEQNAALIKELGYDPIATLLAYNKDLAGGGAFNQEGAQRNRTAEALLAVRDLASYGLIAAPPHIIEREQRATNVAAVDAYLRESGFLPEGESLPSDLERAVAEGRMDPQDAVDAFMLRGEVDRAVADGHLQSNQAAREKLHIDKRYGLREDDDWELMSPDEIAETESWLRDAEIQQRLADAQGHPNDTAADRLEGTQLLQQYVDSIRAQGVDPVTLQQDPELWAGLNSLATSYGMAPEELNALLTDTPPEQYMVDELLLENAEDAPAAEVETTAPPTSAEFQMTPQLQMAAMFPQQTTQLLQGMGPAALVGLGMLAAPEQISRLFGGAFQPKQPGQPPATPATPQPAALPAPKVPAAPTNDNPFVPPPPVTPPAGGGQRMTAPKPPMPKPITPKLPGPGAAPRPGAVPTGVPGS